MADIFTNVDQNALNLTRAIGLQESSKDGKTPDYNATGDAGTSKGAYQWQPGNFAAAAKTAGLDPTDFSPVNQDKVAYSQVKAYKDSGLQPAEIAAMWNSGGKDNWQNHVGDTVINGQPVHYDTPKYVQGVKNYYSGLSQQSPDPTNTQGVDNTQPAQPGLLDNLGGRLNEAVGGIGETVGGVGNLLMGKPDTGGSVASIAQGPLHIAGALAGGLGDVTNAVLDQIPLVKPLENLLGKNVVQPLMQTPVGQSILTSYKDFATKNPELAQDAGDVFNIITAIPILKGIGAVKNVGMDAISQVVKSKAETSYAQGLGEIITKDGKSKLGKTFLTDNPDVTKALVDERAGLNLENGRFVTKDDIENSWGKITDNSDQIQQILETANKNKYTVGNEDPTTILNNTLNGYTDRFGNKVESLSKSKFTPEMVLSNAENLTQLKGKLWDKFANGEASLSEINELRSALDESVKTGYSSITAPPIKKEMGMSLAGAMRDFVQTQAPETQPLFADITKQFKIQKALGFIEGQSPKMGAVGGAIKIAGTLGGEKIGESVGLHPLVSAGIGYRLTSAAEKLHPFSLSRNVLERTGPDATKQSLKSLGWLTGAPIQRGVNPETKP